MMVRSKPLVGPLLAALLAACAAYPASAFDFDDLKTLERAEQDELLEKARQAASSWNFSSARSYLDQARQKGYAPKQVKAVETLIARNESAKADQDRRQEEQRQAKLAAEEADRRRVASSGDGGGGGGSPGWIQVQASCSQPLCLTDKLEVSGGPGSFSNIGGTSMGSINKRYGSGALAGRYSYSVKIDSHWCSGSFSLSGTRSNYAIRVYSNCKDAGSGEF